MAGGGPRILASPSTRPRGSPASLQTPTLPSARRRRCGRRPATAAAHWPRRRRASPFQLAPRRQWHRRVLSRGGGRRRRRPPPTRLQSPHRLGRGEANGRVGLNPLAAGDAAAAHHCLIGPALPTGVASEPFTILALPPGGLNLRRRSCLQSCAITYCMSGSGERARALGQRLGSFLGQEQADVWQVMWQGLPVRWGALSASPSARPRWWLCLRAAHVRLRHFTIRAQVGGSL